MIVGEAPGIDEEKQGRPFAGASGRELDVMLKAAGIERRECYITNVFHKRPPNNSIEKFCCSKTEAVRDYKAERTLLTLNHNRFDWPQSYNFQPIQRGKYCTPERLGNLARLRDEITVANPNIIIALGATANWALTGEMGIAKHRGTLVESSLAPGYKVLPTYHPAAILRNWSLRMTSIADLEKARKEQNTKELVSPRKQIFIEPAVADVLRFEKDHGNAGLFGVDVETEKGQITCIGFAPSVDFTFVIPFWDKTKTRWSYWESLADEIQVLEVIGRLLASKSSKVFHNGLYDIQYIWENWHFPVYGVVEDTMLMHHSMQPEMPKDLGYLSSIHTNNPSWKHLRKHKNDKTNKKDE